MMNRVCLVAGGTVLAVLLVACGGGGGGGAPVGPAPTGTINTGSALAVAGRAVDIALQSGSFGGITDFVGLTVVSTKNSARLGGASVSKPSAPNAWSAIPVGPEITECEVRGTLTVSGDIASPLTVTAGDFLDYEWSDCEDGLGQTLDGLIRMTFTEFDGDLLAGRILLGVSLTVEEFLVSHNAEFRLTNGDLSLTIDSRSQPETTIETLGSSLVVQRNLSTETLTDFASLIVEDTSMFPSNFTTDSSGTVSSTLFNGFVSYSMPTAFESSGDGFPYTGEMLVSGSSGATLRIIAIDDQTVRIEADYNGDGASDATIETSWEALVNG
jgi:hypothetical protein